MTEPDNNDGDAEWAIEAARARGRALIAGFVADGTLVTAAEASRRIGGDVQLQEPDAFVTYSHEGQSVYLASVLALPLRDVAAINRALGTANEGARLVWWQRPHGALGGATILDAVRTGRVARCIEIAQAYADERDYGEG